MITPNPIWIYRITHIANLRHDIQHGMVSTHSPHVNPDFIQIGDRTLIDYRKDLSACDPPGGLLSEYIPFYLGPRSPMLLQIATGWEYVEKYPQEDIIYYISSVPVIQQRGLRYFFTDGHARSKTTLFFSDASSFGRLDWETIYSRNWKSDETDLRRKEKKQGELFVKDHVPVSCIQYIGVLSKRAEQKVLALLGNAYIIIPIRISPDKLYYDHL